MPAWQTRLFVGDSIARFEYLALVLWAETGVLPMCALPALACWYAGGAAMPKVSLAPTPPPPLPAGCAYGTQRWDNFYRWSETVLRGRERCDCSFQKGRHENRVYENAFLGFSAAFYFWMGGSFVGQGDPSDPRTSKCPAGAFETSDEERNRSRWSLSSEQLVRATARLEPTHLIVGPGWWRLQAPWNGFWESLAAAGVAAVAPRAGAVFFRTSLRPNDASGSCHGQSVCQAREHDASALLRHGWRLYDVSAYLRHRYNASSPSFDRLLFADGIHLNPGVNAELVSGLLSQTLCASTNLAFEPQQQASLPPGIGYSITGSNGPHCPRIKAVPTRNAACMPDHPPGLFDAARGASRHPSHHPQRRVCARLQQCLPTFLLGGQSNKLGMGLMARWGYKQPELHESALLAAVPASYTGAAAEGTTEALSGAKTPRKDTYGLQAGFTQLPGSPRGQRRVGQRRVERASSSGNLPDGSQVLCRGSQFLCESGNFSMKKLSSGVSDT